jgi:alkylhydroperoxidase family enzyme
LRGRNADGLSPRQQALLIGVDELLATRTLSDHIWQKLADYLDRQQLIEILTLVGQYDALRDGAQHARCATDYPD